MFLLNNLREEQVHTRLLRPRTNRQTAAVTVPWEQ